MEIDIEIDRYRVVRVIVRVVRVIDIDRYRNLICV